MSNVKKFRQDFIVYRDSEGIYHRDSANDRTPVKLFVVKPTHKHSQLAQEKYTARWKTLVENGAPIRSELNDILRKRKLWNDELQKKDDELIAKIDDNLKKIKGRIKLSEASKLMKENIRLKSELIVLRFSRNQLDQNTAEAMAEQERFNFLVSACTVTEDNKPFFASYEDFLTQDDEGSVVPVMAGEAMWKFTTDTDTDYRANWPEYQFLQKYKMVDAKFNFLNKGKLVDIDDKPIDEEGNYLKEDGSKIADEPMFGEILDDDGNLILDEKEDKNVEDKVSTT